LDPDSLPPIRNFLLNGLYPFFSPPRPTQGSLNYLSRPTKAHPPKPTDLQPDVSRRLIGRFFVRKPPFVPRNHYHNPDPTPFPPPRFNPFLSTCRCLFLQCAIVQYLPTPHPDTSPPQPLTTPLLSQASHACALALMLWGSQQPL